MKTRLLLRTKRATSGDVLSVVSAGHSKTISAYLISEFFSKDIREVADIAEQLYISPFPDVISFFEVETSMIVMHLMVDFDNSRDACAFKLAWDPSAAFI